MNRKTIFYVENERDQRVGMKKALEFRGFRVEAAGTVEEARSIGRRLGEKIDLMLLDMHLDDPMHKDVTGAHIGKEIAARLRWPPEALIITGHPRVDYYQHALDMRAAFLLKTEPTEVVIRHIRALVIRRALTSHEQTAESIARIAEISRNPAEAVTEFGRQVLVPELTASLGAEFVLLVTADGVTQKCGGVAALPEGTHPAYNVIQSLAHGDSNVSKPFVFNSGLLVRTEEGSEEIYSKLHEAAFLPLAVNRDLRLSIGILQGDRTKRFTEDAALLAEVMAGYLRPAVIENMLSLLSRLTESNAERKTVLRETSKFCLFVGQEQLAILADALETKEVRADSMFFRKLKALSTDLRSTGEMLLPLASSEEDKKEVPAVAAPVPDPAPAQAPAVEVADVVSAAWKEVKEQFPTATDINFSVHIEEPCEVEAAWPDISLAVSRLLQWSVQRKFNTPAGEPPRILVRAEQQNNRAEIVFEDRSRRLGKLLRKHLFDPFTQTVPPPVLDARIATAGAEDDPKPKPGLYLPLYLAKMMIEMKCHGKIEDQSDVLAGNLGHRFVVSLPTPELKSIKATR